MNKFSFFFLLLFSFLGTSKSYSQTLEVEFPYYAAREYYLCLLQGAGQDTIATGTLDSQGRTTISVPNSYRGIARFSVKEYGKIWNVIINGNENIKMSEPMPKENSPESETLFENSPENNFLINAMARQSKIINNYTAGKTGTYSPFLPPDQEYKTFQEEVAKSPLFAARIFEILNLLTGVGSSFEITEEQLLDEQREFVANKVDFNDLYISGFWQHTFDLWYQLASLKGQEDNSILLKESKAMLDRCDNIFIRREVTQVIIRLFSKYGKDSLLLELGTEYLTMPLNGQIAPEIETNGEYFLPKNSLIIFYETGCGNCHYELENLKAKYSFLSNDHNNLRIISIAADADKYVFEDTASKLPWTDKFCDFKGFDGENFKNYGIVGTPTFVLTDKEGIVRGRYASLKELINN